MATARGFASPDHQVVLTEPEAVLRYLTGGEAIVTTVSQPTGKHYTYKLVRHVSSVTVHVLAGESNESDYVKLGYVELDAVTGRPTGLPVRTVPSGRQTCWRAFQWLWGMLKMKLDEGAAAVAGTVEVRTSGRCAKCGRLLTAPSEDGFGPVCRTKVGSRRG